MFTGIIEALGVIQQATPSAAGLRLSVTTTLPLADGTLGESIACNGVCLTVVEFLPEGGFTVDVSRETLACTQGLDQEGGLLNLERALRLSDRLGGHLVSGHVDGVGEVIGFEAIGDCRELNIRAPEKLARYIAAKGSLTVNGVSLTVNRVDGATCSIHLIPHTLEKTNLHLLTVGASVNLEIDLVARYCERLLGYPS